MKYTITPLKAGSLFYYRGGFTSNQEEYKSQEEFPVIVFLISGNGEHILVDTGGGDPASEDMIRARHVKSIRAPDERPDRALAKLGVRPEDIGTVILSHLHWDHCYNNDLFPAAEFIVQKREMIAAVSPLPKFALSYETFSAGLVPPWARQRTKWRVVDGDVKLRDGIELLLLPGHTPGLQGVLVETVSGPALLASDAVPLYECIEDIDSGDYHLSSLCENLADFYKTFDKLRELKASGVKIIASHDAETLSLRL